jgi:hypothetical protein
MSNRGAVERVFSILKNSFNDRQTTSLEDFVALSLIRQFNSWKKDDEHLFAPVDIDGDNGEE